jgi:hypothetical protein
VFVCNTVTRELAALSLGSRNAELDHGDPLLPPVALGFDRWRNRYTIGRHHFWLAEDGPELQWSLHFCIDLLVRRKPWTFASRAAVRETGRKQVHGPIAGLSTQRLALLREFGVPCSMQLLMKSTPS